MKNRVDLNLTLAHNLRFFMCRRSGKEWTANELAVKAGIAPNTVRNYLNQKKRTTTLDKPEGFPTIDKLAMLAEHLNCQVWELLHPDIARSIREREMYIALEKDFAIKTKNSAAQPLGLNRKITR